VVRLIQFSVLLSSSYVATSLRGVVEVIITKNIINLLNKSFGKQKSIKKKISSLYLCIWSYLALFPKNLLEYICLVR